MMGSTEIIVVVGVVLVLFGAKAIPKFARSLGQAKREFEKGVSTESQSGEDAASTDRVSDDTASDNAKARQDDAASESGESRS